MHLSATMAIALVLVGLVPVGLVLVGRCRPLVLERHVEHLLLLVIVLLLFLAVSIEVLVLACFLLVARLLPLLV
jgi:hypothetical protein